MEIVGHFDMGADPALVRQGGWRNEQPARCRSDQLAISSRNSRIQQENRSVRKGRADAEEGGSGQILEKVSARLMVLSAMAPDVPWILRRDRAGSGSETR